jgi:hypothetical protein
MMTVTQIMKVVKVLMKRSKQQRESILSNKLLIKVWDNNQYRNQYLT